MNRLRRELFLYRTSQTDKTNKLFLCRSAARCCTSSTCTCWAAIISGCCAKASTCTRSSWWLCSRRSSICTGTTSWAGVSPSAFDRNTICYLYIHSIVCIFKDILFYALAGLNHSLKTSRKAIRRGGKQSSGHNLHRSSRSSCQPGLADSFIGPPVA